MISHPFSPSPEQSTFWSWLDSGRGNTIVRAVAGSGKTTTIVEGLKYISPMKTVLLLAFNKSIAEELKKRVPPNVNASTFHSMGLRALQKVLNPRPKIEQRKVGSTLIELVPNRTERDLYLNFVTKLVSFAKGAMGIGCLEDDLPMLWESVIETHEMFLDEDEGATYEKGIGLARQCLKLSNSLLTQIDFDDMLYLPLVIKAPFTAYDFVFVDEAQDTNAIQRAILAKCLKPSSRLIAVGDESQAIYGFRGADSDAMNLLQEKFNMTNHSLSVCYRCAKSIVQEAARWQHNPAA